MKLSIRLADRLRAWVVMLVVLAAARFATPEQTLAGDNQPTNGMNKTALDEYVARPEPKFAWTVVKKSTESGGKSWLLRLVSQQWQNIVWEHDLQLFEPVKLTCTDKIIIYNVSGKVNALEGLVGPLLAKKTGARVAVLYGNPNQPMFGGLREDDLIAHTYVQYLQSKDPTWPLLFPMTKSIVKAMDALQELAVAEKWDTTPRQYLITGGSKRGWASWLAAVVDSRVFAVAPIVIEIKMRQQMANQLAVLGANTDKLAPYSSRGLTKPATFDTPEGHQLWQWVDPWMYRERLVMPKLLIKATNDPWWLLESMNIYWDDLAGPKHCLYFPNEVHELPQSRPQAAEVVSAFFLRATRGETLPKITWQHQDTDGGLKVSLKADEPAARARLWTAASATKDFRLSRWTAVDMTYDGEQFSAVAPRQPDHHTAVFGEIQFQEGGLKYSLSTDVRAE